MSSTTVTERPSRCLETAWRRAGDASPSGLQDLTGRRRHDGTHDRERHDPRNDGQGSSGRHTGGPRLGGGRLRLGATITRLGVPLRALCGRRDPGDLPMCRYRPGHLDARHRLRVGTRCSLRRRDGCRRSRDRRRGTTRRDRPRPVPAADLRVGNMFELPWADESFDAVTSINGVWGGCEGALVEAHRVLKPGGRIGISFWGKGHLDLRACFIAFVAERAGDAHGRDATHQRHRPPRRCRGDARVDRVRGARTRRPHIDRRVAGRRHGVAGDLERRPCRASAGEGRRRRPAPAGDGVESGAPATATASTGSGSTNSS